MDELESRQAKAGAGPRAGEDLSRLSESELTERIDLFSAEIARLHAELNRRDGVRAAAEALFGKPSS